MAKRFTSTDIWDEDWFLDMPNEYKLFWYYMLSNCDHAGFFKVNLRSFCGLLEVNVGANKILEFFNSNKQRIRIISENIWFIEDFIAFQYGHTFNINNPLHKGIKKQLDKYGIELTSIRGLNEVNLTTKEKDKEKEIKKGGVGENRNQRLNGQRKRGIRFDEEFEKVFFDDDTFQTLGESQKMEAKMGLIRPQKILQGSIY
jgi:hypothetical protein